jgi:hypothetical protein
MVALLLNLRFGSDFYRIIFLALSSSSNKVCLFQESLLTVKSQEGKLDDVKAILASGANITQRGKVIVHNIYKAVS